MTNPAASKQSHELSIVTCKKLLDNFTDVVQSLLEKDQSAIISRHGRWIAILSPAQLPESLESVDLITQQPSRGQRVVSLEELRDRFNDLMHDLVQTIEIGVIVQQDRPVAAICPLAPGIESRLIVMALESGAFDLNPSSADSVPVEELPAEEYPHISH